MQLWKEQETSLSRVALDVDKKGRFLVAANRSLATCKAPDQRAIPILERAQHPKLKDPFKLHLELIELKEKKRAQLHEASYITEFVKLSKREVSAVIGSDAQKINYICKLTRCRIVLMPVSFESINIRAKGVDLLQTLALTGRVQEVAQAKLMLQKALLELKGKQAGH